MAPAVIRPFRKVFINPFFHEEKVPSDPDKSRMDVFTFRLPSADSANPIESEELTHLSLPSSASQGVDDHYFIFVPAPLQARAHDFENAGNRMTIKISILFAVGDQMQRAGLRSFFENANDSVLITCPGTETDPRYGWGIDDTMIKKLFKLGGIDKHDFEVHVIAGYSTGYRGMQGTVLNGKITLTNLKRMIYYDCLYKATDYSAGFKTADAVDKVLLAASSAKIIVYESTQGGTIRYSPGSTLALPASKISTHIDLRTNSPQLSALTYARLLDEGILDKFFKLTDVNYVSALLPLPTRGSLVSDPLAMPSGATGKTLLADWGKTNAAAIGKLNRADAGETVFNHKLMGWFPPRAAGQTLDTAVTAAMLHDQFMPEFAWEFLPP